MKPMVCAIPNQLQLIQDPRARQGATKVVLMLHSELKLRDCRTYAVAFDPFPSIDIEVRRSFDDQAISVLTMRESTSRRKTPRFA